MAETNNPKALKRLHKELQQVAEDGQVTGIEAWIIDKSNPFRLGASIRGPAGTPYHGGTFELLVDYSNRLGYGFSSPNVRFETFCFHPYVGPVSGKVGLVRSACSVFGGNLSNPVTDSSQFLRFICRC